MCAIIVLCVALMCPDGDITEMPSIEIVIKGDRDRQHLPVPWLLHHDHHRGDDGLGLITEATQPVSAADD